MKLPKILTQYCPKNTKSPEILTQNRPKYMKLHKILPEIWTPYTNRGGAGAPHLLRLWVWVEVRLESDLRGRPTKFPVRCTLPNSFGDAEFISSHTRPGARVTWLGGNKQFLGRHKNFISSNSSVKTIKKGLYRKICAKFHEFWSEDQKNKQTKDLHCDICAKFHEFWGKDQKKVLHRKNCEKTVLAHEYWVNDKYFGDFRTQTALHLHRANYFLWGTILAWGAHFSFGEGVHGLEMPPRAAGPESHSNEEQYKMLLWPARI